MTDDVNDDRQVLRRVAQGDRLAFKVLYARHNVRLFRYLARLTGEKALAEDLLHDVFLEVWRSASRYEGRSAPQTWMMSIAHHRAIDLFRKRGVVLDAEPCAEMEDDAATPEVQEMMRDKSGVIRRCLSALSPEHRAIIDLVYYQEKSVIEIGEILSIPEPTVKTRMFYARKRLQKLLIEAGVDAKWP